VTLAAAEVVVCPLCNSAEFVKRRLFFTYCANPAHTHKKGEPVANTILEFRWCIEHGVPDDCVKALLEPTEDEGPPTGD